MTTLLRARASRLASVLLFGLVGLGCSAEASFDDLADEDAAVRGEALGDDGVEPMQGGETFLIQLEGLCSTHFLQGKTEGRLAHFDGVTPVDAYVDQRESMAVATSQLKAILDAYCLGDNACYVYTYSNGGAVISRTLSLYDTDWNILYVLNTASNEGGSELGGTGWLGEKLGSCTLSGHVGPADHRPGWNHNDTGGTSIYQIGGYDGWWYSSILLPKKHDGAVSFHSAAGLSKPMAASSLCQSKSLYWDGHEVAWSCEGYPLDHMGMKMKGLCELGGCE